MKNKEKVHRYERQMAWIRHNLNQNIESAETAHIPYRNTSAGFAEALRLKMRAEAQKQMLELLTDPPPAHFKASFRNSYAERWTDADDD